MLIINTHKAKTHLSQYLDEVILGKEIIIGKAGKPIAKLIPIKQPISKRVGGQLAGQIDLTKDFDNLPSDFLKYFTPVPESNVLRRG